MTHNWEEALDTSSDAYRQLEELYRENDSVPKVKLPNRNLHHKWLRSWSKKLGEPVDNDADNLVSLSKGDHLLAHYLLWQCSKTGYRVYTAQAFTYMYRLAKKYIGVDTVYQMAEDWDKIVLRNPAVSESNRKRKGKPHSKEHIQKVAEARKVPIVNLYTGEVLPERTLKHAVEFRTGKNTGSLHMVGDHRNIQECWITKREFDQLGLLNLCDFSAKMVGLYKTIHWLERYDDFERIALLLVETVKVMRKYKENNLKEENK